MDATQEGAILGRLENYLSAQDAPTEVPEQEEVKVVEETAEAKPETQEAEGSEEDVQDEVEESHIELSKFAAILGIDEDRLDVDEDGGVYVKTKVDGEEGRAKFQDLVKSYQLEGHLNKQNMEVAEQRKALQAKMAEAEQQAQQRIQQLDSAVQIAHQELMREFQSVNWQELRQIDPGEYAAKLTEYQQREARITQAAQQAQAEKYQAQIKNQERIAKALQEEGAKLMNAIPEWSNPEVAQKERAEIRQFALSNGYQPEEIDNLTDHRAALMLRDAMRYRKLQNSKPDVMKKVVKAPTLVKPGSPVSKQDRDGESLKTLKSNVIKSGGKDGIEAYLLKSGKV